ncbi:ergothioneine biosynthesis glutamate--cysteine ligase EgtA [Micromonospora polyrhachis]|uniref:Glutamate--cysteine ligase EgtA n=1 Tax=Micromonospora polyrhachis TaxID=1282883 RepID=A0A7W7WT29_9ACTN|nr:ergothioneine biosynthesis glutamate--cysteine ligase EgtA [Micromonospora polyrhachis]MBB4962028.1 glutamate--cysteine ligase [Micromonospora polyrhachis]
MTTRPELDSATVLREVGEAEGYLAKICFKTGPPRLVGVELEWTVHDAVDPAQPVDPDRLRTALGPHAPTTLDPGSTSRPLPQRGTVTVEPGGQVEISTIPHRRLDALHETTSADIDYLTGLLAAAGLVLGRTGIDPYRPPRPAIDTPRYRAMRCAFDRRGPSGRAMMYSTAGLQICFDAGMPAQVAARWQALHAYGPPLVAAFATAGRYAGRDTGWASARMAAWQRIDPDRTRAAWTRTTDQPDPARAWSAYALAAPLLCVRRPGDANWAAPPGVTFQDWINGALPQPPTTDDLDYHLSTLFPPVRPRGYLEVRYLDSQPAGEWIAPVAVLAALLTDDSAAELAREACEPVVDQWERAARYGLADPDLSLAAATVLDVACRALDRTDLPPTTRQRISEIVQRRLTVAERGAP